MKSGKVTENSIAIIRILRQNPEGVRTRTINKLTAIPTRTIYNILRKLRNQNLVINIFPIWKLSKTLSSKMAKLLKRDNIQAHKFSFILRLIDKPSWWEKRQNRLIRLKEFQFKKVTWGRNPYEILSKNQFLIQTFSNSIVFINQKQYYGQDSYECFIQSLEDTLEMLRFIEERFRFKFYHDGIPQFSVRSQHYIKLRDVIAKKCKKLKKLFELTIDGRLRAWIDLSEPFGIEFGHKNFAVEDTRKYKNFVSDIISKEHYSPSETKETIEGLLKLQAFNSHNLIKHQQVLDEMSKTLKQIRDNLK